MATKAKEEMDALSEPWWSDRVPDESRELARKVYDLEVRQNLHRPSTDSDTAREMWRGKGGAQ